MADSQSGAREASVTTGIVMACVGVAFLCGGLVLAYVVARLLFSETPQLDLSAHDQLFWVLCGIVAACLLMLAHNFFKAAWHRRVHNVVPGPTLYLLGVTLVILGMFLAVGGTWIGAGILALAGVACMQLEYGSEFI